MSLSFDDMMKKFYDDPKLGIQTEDAPTTSTANVPGAGDDSSTVVVKRKKKPYDGRTKEASAKAIVSDKFFEKNRKLKSKKRIKTCKESAREYSKL